eukprot:TRINITY_DN7928_c0_g1_i2.p1 TRINITY_DN7928_c0_g1~~TRINITY_DN7928_c0_g1_i2.p1  ORF type:complete len:164 (+),score=35.88 TRINITY_DN7928_c0_g1_i2:47-538(+)
MVVQGGHPTQPRCYEGNAIHGSSGINAEYGRDLSSNNILLDTNEMPKLCDFGLSRFKAPNDNNMSTAVGAAAWMAPEVWRGGAYDHKVDVYSFGIVCWEICTGGDPYCGLDPLFYLQKVAMEGFRPPLPDSLSRDWKRLIIFCWADKPNHRPDFRLILNELNK